MINNSTKFHKVTNKQYKTIIHISYSQLLNKRQLLSKMTKSKFGDPTFKTMHPVYGMNWPLTFAV